jgi:aerobic-type carbon monoxide dehydrogenase small subunit (CoxS/CutS family)
MRLAVMEKTIAFTVNGQPRNVTTDPTRPLLEVLREDLQMTGTKFGCGEGRCGACTVLVGGKSEHSCVTPLEKVEGQKIITIEGLAQGDMLHPVQEAFLEEGASQCGFCAPGMIMALIGLLMEKAKPTEAEVASRMEGNICRCCNYPKLHKAIHRAVAAQAGRSVL